MASHRVSGLLEHQGGAHNATIIGCRRCPGVHPRRLGDGGGHAAEGAGAGTGGAAWGHSKVTDTFVQQQLGSPTNIVTVSRASANDLGWVAGAGAEWKLWNSGMMLRVEYLHYDFRSASLAFDTINTQGTSLSFKLPLERLTTDVVRGGVSYKF